MKTIRNIADATNILNTYISPQRTKYTLNNMRRLMNHLGNPQNNLKIIHIAGTSGKTSTCYYTASLLREAGYKVGLTISPHIASVNERVQINLVPLEETIFCSMLSEFLERIDTSGISPSYFELLVAFAYWVFDQLAVDYAVIEVGLGGLLDGTNVIDTPEKISVITDIGYDHVEILGETIQEITKQKSGIIHAGNVVFMHTQTKEIVDIVKQTSTDIGATLYVVEETDLRLPLPVFQNRNLSLALAACEHILKRNNTPNLTTSQIAQASSVAIPGRMETFHVRGKTLILDGAHNAQKTDALVQSIRQMYPQSKVVVLVSFGKNKLASAEECLKRLHTLCDDVVITMFNKGQDEFRAPTDSSIVAEMAKSVGYKSITILNEPSEALDALLTKSSDIYLVTGSLYLVSQIRPNLRLSLGEGNI